MSEISNLPARNRLLASLPQPDYQQLRPHFEPVELPLRRVLYEVGEPVEHCYFVDRGMVSLVIPLEDGTLIEAGVVGNEGVVGLPGLLAEGMAAPHTSMIQLPGEGWRVATEILRAAMLRSPALLERVLRFSQALSIQISQTAVCNARHELPQRLARWLLLAHDRNGEGDVLALTHEFISMMLAVRRPGVTVSAAALQASGAIDYQRGRIRILDRRLLEATSCECYRVCREQSRQVLEPLPTAASELPHEAAS
jgi:CRP-like cAMP-binding protein